MDLEDRLHETHLEDDSVHLTAFITPFGVYELLLLPMGVKMSPWVFQRLVQWVLHCIPCSFFILDSVLTGTGRAPHRPQERGKGQVLDSHALSEPNFENFLRRSFSPPPILPDGSSKTSHDPFYYEPPAEPSLRDDLYYQYSCLRQTFHALAQADLPVKPDKCFLLREQVQYIGHILSKGTRIPNLAKTVNRGA